MSADASLWLPVRYRHLWLLVSLMLEIFAGPFVPRGVAAGLLEILLLITLLAGANATATRNRTWWALAPLVGLSVITRLGWLFFASSTVLYCFLLCYLAFCAAVAILILRSLFQEQDRITPDTLYGATSVYLLLGLMWVMAFTILERACPGSFRFDGVKAPDNPQFNRFMGFSFTTLTTLGYGNVAPATPKADALATLEAIVGQLYVAIVIARLVALELNQINRSGVRETEGPGKVEQESLVSQASEAENVP